MLHVTDPARRVHPALRAWRPPRAGSFVAVGPSDATSAGRAAPARVRARCGACRRFRCGRGRVRRRPLAASGRMNGCRPRRSRAPHAPPGRSKSTVRRSRRCWRRCPPRGSRSAGAGSGAGRGVVAGIALPPFDNSAMDGYAVRAADVAGATDAPGRRCPSPPTSRPGAPTSRRSRPGHRRADHDRRPLPAGADAIVQVEHTDGGTDTRARSGARPRPARTCAGRRRTSRRARSCCRRARCSGPPQIGVAAAVGVRHAARCAAGRRCSCCPPAPSWSRPGTPLQPGQIYESNGPMLAAAVEDAGGGAELLRFVPDDVAQFLRRCSTSRAAGTSTSCSPPAG